jgi:DNA-binding MarR family transcriptional regulator
MKKTELIQEIVRRQRQINRALSQNNPDVWMGLSLTIAQVKSLFFIADAGKVNFRKLANALKVTPSNVTGIVDRLVERDLVSRTENQEDRRMLILQLTPRGKALIDNLRQQRAVQIAAILKDISEEDLSAIERGFALFAGAVENYYKE